MAEESGSFVIKANEEILSMLSPHSDASEVVSKLFSIGGVDADVVNDLNCSIKFLEIKDGHACFDFDCSDWKAISDLLLNKSKGLEWYSRTYDEYGTTGFYLMNESAGKVHFSFDQGGDLCEVEGYVDEAKKNMSNWLSLVSNQVNELFPEFVDTDNIMFYGP